MMALMVGWAYHCLYQLVIRKEIAFNHILLLFVELLVICLGIEWDGKRPDNMTRLQSDVRRSKYLLWSYRLLGPVKDVANLEKTG